MKKCWMGLCLALALVWGLVPAAQAAGPEAAGPEADSQPYQTGHSIVGIETVGPEVPPEWYEFTVTVMDEEHNLLEGVVLRLYPVLPDGSHGSAITGINGQYMTGGDGRQFFRIPPPGGTFRLEATLAGYEDYDSGEFEITADGSMIVVLKKQPAKPPATGDSARLYGYILVCLLAAAAVTASLMGELERKKREENR